MSSSAAEISIEPVDTDTYQVEVGHEEGASTHRVTIPTDEVASLGGGASAEELIEESFRFLLEREDPRSLHSSFRLSEIADSFPEYPEEIRLRLEGTAG